MTFDKDDMSHLKKLKRPRAFDTWLGAYNPNGFWDGTELKRLAERDREQAMQPLFSCYCFLILV